MRTYLQSKAMAKALREELAALDLSLTHSQCLELVAIAFTPWDSREFEVTDPFGNQLRFWENNPPGVARSGAGS